MGARHIVARSEKENRSFCKVFWALLIVSQAREDTEGRDQRARGWALKSMHRVCLCSNKLIILFQQVFSHGVYFSHRVYFHTSPLHRPLLFCHLSSSFSYSPCCLSFNFFLKHIHLLLYFIFLHVTVLHTQTDKESELSPLTAAPDTGTRKHAMHLVLTTSGKTLFLWKCRLLLGSKNKPSPPLLSSPALHAGSLVVWVSVWVSVWWWMSLELIYFVLSLISASCSAW